MMERVRVNSKIYCRYFLLINIDLIESNMFDYVELTLVFYN